MKKTINRKSVKTPKMMYNKGGEVTKKDSYEVGDKIKYMDTFRREENDGTIYQINELGTYIVSTGMGVRGVQKEEVIGVYPKEEPKKKRFGLFAEGGSIAEGNYEMILSQAKEVEHHVNELQDILKNEDDIEAWVVAKMENVTSNLSDITHYLDGKSEMPMAKHGMKLNKLSASDVSNAKYVGVIEFEDNQGEFHNFEVMETEDRLVFGGMTNSGFIESGYIEKDGRSTDETLQNMLEDL
jgi:hypothetical protein